jgi:hypothetical protein
LAKQHGDIRTGLETFRMFATLLTPGSSLEAIMANALGRSLFLFGVMLFLSTPPASADDGANGPQARALIERQLDAFAHDDAAAAYALAAPGLKTIFTDPDTFLTMVRSSYAPVYRHRSIDFGQIDVDGDNISQVLTIVDDDNVVWKALYKLARQPDGQWLINGCLLIKSSDTST